MGTYFLGEFDPAQSGQAIQPTQFLQSQDRRAQALVRQEVDDPQQGARLAVGVVHHPVSADEVLKSDRIVRMNFEVSKSACDRSCRPALVHALQDLVAEPQMAKVGSPENEAHHKPGTETTQVSPECGRRIWISDRLESSQDLQNEPDSDNGCDRDAELRGNWNTKAEVADAIVCGATRNTAACSDQGMRLRNVSSRHQGMKTDTRKATDEVDDEEPQGSSRQFNRRPD